MSLTLSISSQSEGFGVAREREKPTKEGFDGYRKYTIRQKKRICVCSGGITAKSIEFTVSRPDKNSGKLGQLPLIQLIQFYFDQP